MKSRLAPANWPLAAVLFFCSLISDLSAEVQRAGESGEVGSGYLNIGRRALMGFKETPNGGNITYECSPSGPCVPCAYSEKNDEKYRCSETGYRIPLKCVDTGSDSKETNGKKLQKGRSALESMKVMQPVNMNSGDKLTIMAYQRHLLDESTTSDDGRQAYITYRSCIPAANEEKLSVLGFEVRHSSSCINRCTFAQWRSTDHGCHSGDWVHRDYGRFAAYEWFSHILQKEES